MLTGRRLQHWRRGSKNGKLFFDGFSFCIMAEASQYRPIPELDLSGPAHVVAERWRRWKRSFDLYIAGQDIDDATRKHSLLLHYAGMNVQDLFETLTEPAQPEDRYAKTIAMLDGQFKVAKNTPFERHVFRQMCPEANEPIDKFVARLRQQARLCEYSDLDDQLRDQLLDKIAQPGLRRKLLEKEDMTLDDALKICRSWEATAHQTAQMSSSATSSATTTTVHAVAHSSQQQRRKWNQPRTPPHREEPECPNCGFQGHMAGDSCPARGRTCHKCGKKNHFSRKCHSNNRTDSTRAQLQHERIQPRQGRAHHVTDRDDTRTDSNDFETVFTVGQTVTTPTPRVTIRISEAETTAIVDSGASCNLLGTDQLVSLRRLGLQTTLVPCRQALYAYGSTQPLKLAGQFTVPTSINGKTIPTTFIVIDGPGDILLGKTSSELFGAIHFDTTMHTNNVTNEDQAFRLSLQQHFPAVFEGVGKLRGHQATIHIDPTVTPVAQRPRRVPFALRPKVRDHLKDLMEKDIIEKVDGPSPWVSPVVVTPKPKGDIRLCVDMRRANEAIIRERHPIPTIDEVTNIADALSRMPVDSADDEFTTLLTEESVRFVTKTAVPNALTAQQVEQASRIDPELCNTRKCLESGQLDSLPKPFLGVRHELTYVGCVVIRGTRIIFLSEMPWPLNVSKQPLPAPSFKPPSVHPRRTYLNNSTGRHYVGAEKLPA